MSELTPEQMQERIDQIEREAMGGRGFIAQITYNFGYKVFVADFSNEDTWFPYTFAEGSQQEALTKAKVFIKENSVLDNKGNTARPQPSIGFVVPLGTVLMGGDNWNVDQYFITPLYYDAYNQVLKPAIKDLALFPGTFWGRFGWIAEPSGRTRENQEGRKVAVLVAYPMEIYDSQSQAEAAVSELGGSVTRRVEMPGWLGKELARLQEVVDNLRAAEEPASDDDIANALAGELGVEAAEAIKFIQDDVEAKVDMLAEAYGKQYKGAISAVLNF